MEKIEIHPFEPFIPEAATKLIIGTIPPSRFCKIPQELSPEDVNFYYGSKDNEFWPLIQTIFNKDFKYENSIAAIEQRKALLTEVSIGITDIVEECFRTDNGSSDKSLKIIKYKDLKSLLVNNSDIKTLIYTSEFVKTQVNSYFHTYHSIIDKDNKKRQTVMIEKKPYNVRILYSPSPQALRNMGENGAMLRLEQYREFLVNE